MKGMPPRAPVALIIFNRPEETERVFAAIRAARPERLFVIADGPRTETERSLTDAARAVIDTVDWPGTVEKNYADTNLGCRDRIISGINWVFEHTDRAIILEDDCLPDPTFFPFCDELLERYKDDERVMTVAGTCFFKPRLESKKGESYFATLIPHTTGWATWRRAWELYDPDMKAWPTLRDSKTLAPRFKHPAGYERFERVWDDYYYKRDGVKDSWDGAWVFACISNRAVCLNPSVNLISNIGFNERATHSREDHPQANLPTSPLTFPLVHPVSLKPRRDVDALMYRYNFGVDQFWYYRMARPLKTYTPGLYRTFKRWFLK